MKSRKVDLSLQWRSVATPSRRPSSTWSRFKLLALRATAQSTLTAETVGNGRSRLETSRDGPRPLEAASNSDRALVTAVRHTARRMEACHRGPAKKHSKASASDSSYRAIAAAPRTPARPRPSPARRTSSLSRSGRTSSAEPTRTTRPLGSDRAQTGPTRATVRSR